MVPKRETPSSIVERPIMSEAKSLLPKTKGTATTTTTTGRRASSKAQADRRLPPGAASQSGGSRPRQNAPAAGLQFINTMQPGKFINAQSLSQIRSHVARDAHARRRQLKPRAANSRDVVSNGGLVSPRLSEDSASSPEALSEGKSKDDEDDVSIDIIVKPNSLALGRKIAPKLRARQKNSYFSEPQQLIGDGRSDACKGNFAWCLSDDEQFLFDYYFDWAITNGYEGCVPKEHESAHQEAMRTIYVPFAMSNVGPLVALFYAACRRYVLMADDEEKAKKYKTKMLRYRLIGLQLVKEAVASESAPSDATIALAMIMGGESFWEGDPVPFRIHGNAVLEMVSARGGLDKLGVSGFLAHLIRTCIYNPNFQFVPGPSTII